MSSVYRVHCVRGQLSHLLAQLVDLVKREIEKIEEI